MARDRRLQHAVCKTQVALAIAVCFAQAHLLWADDAKPPPPQSLLDRTPFDLVILNQANGNERLEVQPLDLPQRPLTNLPAQGSLRVRLLERPTEEFDVAWNSIAHVRVFEQLLFEEAQRLATAGKFDDAYDYFARLLGEYPQLAGLDDAISDYLRRNALALYQAKENDRALALLLTLHQRNPKYPGLDSAVGTIAGDIIQRYLREGNYSAARRVLELWRSQFPGLAVEAANEWQRRFEAAAARQVEEAARLVGQKQYVAARKAVNRALGIWPDLDAARNILAQIEVEFPFVTVGVLQASPRTPARRIDLWAALRTSRLIERLLAEQIEFGSEGGVYRSPYGELLLDESGRELSLKLNPQSNGAPSADSVARYLLSMGVIGSPLYRADFASLLGGISIGPSSSVDMQFVRVHVRPEAMLQVPPPNVAELSGSRTRAADFVVADYAPEQIVFTAINPQGGRGSGPLAIVEQKMADDETAVSALLAGEVDVLDRVPPWHIERLRGAEGIQVQSYRLPTVHVLIPNLERPLPAKREFRRALCFGIDRKWIVQRVLLAGATLPGYEVVSGPFPAGVSLSDPIRYGYNNQVLPRPFEPRLAAILATVAWAGVQNPTGKKDAPEPGDIPELTLALPSDPVARVACQSIQAQLVREGIPIKLREFAASELLIGHVDCDLRYAELAVWEPLADARPLLGPGGLAGNVRSPYLNAALSKLDAATNWADVRTRLAEVHEIAHHELPVIPLWQTVNFFAYRKAIGGIGDAPITLYQNVDQWTLSAGSNVARLAPSPQ